MINRLFKNFTLFVFVIILGNFVLFLAPTKVTAESSGYTANNGKLFKNGEEINLHGVNWFGAETESHVQHGLWQRNWKDMISQIKTIGFNAVRIPFCPETVHGTAVSSINYSLNPDLINLNSQQIFDKVLLELNSQKIYFILDFHRINCTNQTFLWYENNYSEDQWIDDLKFVANRYKNFESFAGIDLKNEPGSPASWGIDNRGLDWNSAAERAGAAVNYANPNILIFVQGITQNAYCSDETYSHFWGENLQPYKCKPISSSYIPENKLILSPHVYGPDVYPQSYFFANNFPNNMPAIWDQHWGNLTTSGVTLVPGEWGGKYGNGGVQKDVQWQNSFVDYLINKKICSSFYWSLNPNSVDTGGILQDDWSTPWKNKIDLLKKYFNSCNTVPNVTPVVTVLPAKSNPIITTPKIKPPTITSTSAPVNNSTFYNTNDDSNSITKCIISYNVRAKWDTGYTMDVTVKNISGAKINNWKLTEVIPNGHNIEYMWSAKYWKENNTVNIINEYWNNEINDNSSIQFGYNSTYNNTFSLPNEVKLNDMTCKIN